MSPLVSPNVTVPDLPGAPLGVQSPGTQAEYVELKVIDGGFGALLSMVK